VKKGWQPGLGSILAVIPLVMPVWALVLTHLGQGASSYHVSQRTLEVARYVVWGVAVCMFAAAFVMEWVVRRASDRLCSRGYNPEVFVLRANVATVSSPPVLAFVVCLLGGPSVDVYVLAFISLAFGLFWCWRKRGVLIINGKLGSETNHGA
jgi:hypothetical protein